MTAPLVLGLGLVGDGGEEKSWARAISGGDGTVTSSCRPLRNQKERGVCQGAFKVQLTQCH